MITDGLPIGTATMGRHQFPQNAFDDLNLPSWVAPPQAPSVCNRVTGDNWPQPEWGRPRGEEQGTDYVAQTRVAADN